MKRFLITFAVMLLVSVSTFAQSSPTLQGDVNEDGVVDVADIVAVISIMKSGGGIVTGGYFYLGSTQPTADNYKTLPGLVDSYTSIDEAIGTTVSVDAGQTLYMLCPAAWMDGKTVEIEDKSGITHLFLDTFDATTISGYVIYKTQVWNTSSEATLKNEETAKLTVQIGRGTSYANAVFTDTGRQLSEDMHLTQDVNAGDYLFLKIDKTQNISLVTTDNDMVMFNSEIAFDAPVIDGDYKYYKKTDAYPRAITARVLIVTIY